jgi:hypothetical protein
VREPRQKCEGGNRVARLCTDPDCKKQALMCAETKCEKCSKAHLYCYKVDLEGVTNILNERVNMFHDFAAQMMHIENALIAAIQQNRRKLMQHFQLEELKDKDQLAIFNQIYGEKAGKTLTGKDGKNFFEKIKM